jgi:hypothetical protein
VFFPGAPEAYTVPAPLVLPVVFKLGKSIFFV